MLKLNVTFLFPESVHLFDSVVEDRGNSQPLIPVPSLKTTLSQYQPRPILTTYFHKSNHIVNIFWDMTLYVMVDGTIFRRNCIFQFSGYPSFNLVEFISLCLNIQNNHSYGSVFIQQLHVSVEFNHHQAINTIFKKKVRISYIYYIVLFTFLWDPTSFSIFYNKLQNSISRWQLISDLNYTLVDKFIYIKVSF